MIRRLSLVLGLALLGASACTGADRSSAPERPRCQPRLTVPSGFTPLETFESEQRGYVGVRLGFRDQDRREIYVAAGIPGEWGEGMASAGRVVMRGGRLGTLVTANGDTWMVIWDEGDRCDPRVAIGNGFSREEFLELLATTGLAPSASEPSPSGAT